MDQADGRDGHVAGETMTGGQPPSDGPDERSVLRRVCEAYGGDPADPAWHTAAGVASIIEDLSGLARIHAAEAARWKWAAERGVSAVPPTEEPEEHDDNDPRPGLGGLTWGETKGYPPAPPSQEAGKP